jgi:hypothetical protein
VPTAVARVVDLRGVLVRGRAERGARRRPRPVRPRRCTGYRSWYRSTAATGCAGPSRRSPAWSYAAALGAVEQVRAVRGGRAGDRVRRADPDRRLRAVRDRAARLDPQHLAVVVVGVAGRAAGVLVGDRVRSAVLARRLGRIAGRALGVRVVARVAAGALRRVRVAGRDVQVAGRVEPHAAADVAAAEDLGVVLEDPHLRAEVDRVPTTQMPNSSAGTAASAG